MASITKLPNTSKNGKKRPKPWRVEIRRKGHGAIRECFRTRAEAQEFAAKVESDLGKWTRLLGRELRTHTLGDLLDKFVETYTAKDESVLARAGWWKESFGDYALAEFTIDSVRDGLAQLEDATARQGGVKVTQTTRKLSPATLNRYRTAISTVYKEAIRRGWFGVRENPAAGIKQETENNNRFGRCLEEHERGPLLEACDADSWTGLGTFVRLALATGARRGELLGLTWGGVDFKGGSITLVGTKNGDDRVVPLVGEALDVLKTWSKVRRLDDPRVFPGPTLEQDPPLDSAWRRVKAVAGISNLRVHDLRHSVGTFLARSGATALEVAAVLGHRSGPTLTQRYIHLVAQDSRGLMERALGGSWARSKPCPPTTRWTPTGWPA